MKLTVLTDNTARIDAYYLAEAGVSYYIQDCGKNILFDTGYSADELTYNLHIMIRYYLEKMLFDREIGFEELPEYWNRKYKEYLGVTPKNDTEGVLQDMHWSSGYIGYFQSYVMGNFYDGHYYAAMHRDIPDFCEQVARVEFSAVTG